MRDVKLDRRTIRTRKLYESALINMLKTKDINKITVKDLSEAVDLNRGTFYIHYDDIYDLLESIENNIISELEHFAQDLPVGNISQMFEEGFSKIVKALEFIDNNREVFKVLLSERGNILFLTHIKKTFSKKIFHNFLDVVSNENAKYNSIVSSFLISGFIGIIQEWIKDNEGLSVFELSAFILSMLKSSLNTSLEHGN